MGEAEAYIEGLPMWAARKNSLADVRKFLQLLGNPDRQAPAIHVAGTNGKGSVCAFLTAILRRGGLRVGTFTSPHLIELRERICIDGEPVSRELFAAGFQAVRAAVSDAQARGLCHPTYFEFLFYLAMVLFAREQVDVMVVETGLGGRLDVTNVLERPAACVITSISLDHMKYLGDTVEAIAGEKAGIIKAGVPVVYDGTAAAAAAVIARRAQEAGAPAWRVDGTDYKIQPAAASSGLVIDGRLLDGSTLRLALPFEAGYQAQNAMLAVRTLEVLRDRGAAGMSRLTPAVLAEGAARARWPGRMEQAAPGIYLDGAHNPGGIEAFLRAARALCGRAGKPAWLLFAAVSDKDYQAMAAALCEGFDWQAIGVVHMESDRGLSAAVLAESFRRTARCPVASYEDTAAALTAMRRQAEGGLLFCAGSLYLIGELERLLQTEKGDRA